MRNDSEKFRSYLLGSLPQPEAEEIDFYIISDEQFAADLAAAENDLIEDYLNGELTTDETHLLLENYLVTPARKENIQLVLMLREYSKAHPANISHLLPDSNRSFFSTLKSKLLAVPSPAYGLVLLLVIGLLAAYAWLSREDPRKTFQTEYAELNRQDLSDLEGFANYPNVTIYDGNLRGDAPAAIIRADARTEHIFMRLILPREFRNYTAFEVRLKKDRTTLLLLDSQRFYRRSQTSEMTELRILVPSKIFEKGMYQIEIAPTGESEYPATYYLNVN